MGVRRRSRGRFPRGARAVGTSTPDMVPGERVSSAGRRAEAAAGRRDTRSRRVSAHSAPRTGTTAHRLPPFAGTASSSNAACTSISAASGSVGADRP